MALVQALGAAQMENRSRDVQQILPETVPVDRRLKRPGHLAPEQRIEVPVAPVILSPAANSALQNIDSSQSEGGKE
jgi:hypothetical protein